MWIGVPKEIKPDERRVGMTPAGVRELVGRGHEVLVETTAGEGAGFADGAFEAEGARIVAGPDDVYERADLVVKVKEPQPPEVGRLRRDQILFCYLHLAAEPELLDGLVASGAACIAYETVTDAAGGLPLLVPMSEIAGRLAAQLGAHFLLAPHGGRGVLPGGVGGTRPARAVVIGGGTAGEHAAIAAAGLGFEITVLDRSSARLRELARTLPGRPRTLYATDRAIEDELPDADLVVGAVLLRGDRAPRVVRAEHLRLLRRGSVLLDISIDQGGCFETSRPTTHSAPTYVVDGIVHSCITNLPGAVPVSSTLALVNATLPSVLALADEGLAALRDDPGLAAGANVVAGAVTHPAVAKATGSKHVPLDEATGVLV